MKKKKSLCLFVWNEEDGFEREESWNMMNYDSLIRLNHFSRFFFLMSSLPIKSPIASSISVASYKSRADVSHRTVCCTQTTQHQSILLLLLSASHLISYCKVMGAYKQISKQICIPSYKLILLSFNLCACSCCICWQTLFPKKEEAMLYNTNI